MIHKLKSLCVIILLIGVAACASYDYNKQIAEVEKMFYAGQYKEAARKLLPMVNKKSKDQLLYMMECGLMLQVAGDYENSIKVLTEAAKIGDQITISLSKEAASLLLNETTTNYNGEDFERVLIHMYLGINYLMLQKPDEARVEFKKVNDMLRDINVTTGKSYKQNLMAKYLTAIAFEQSADVDNDMNDREFAYIEYKQIYELNPGLTMVYRDLQRLAKQLGDTEDYNNWVAKFGKQDAIPNNAGELILIVQNGKGAIKQSRGPLLSDKSMKATIQVTLNGMSLAEGVTVAGVLLALHNAENPIPKFVKRGNNINHVIVNVNGNDVARSVMLEDVASTAVKTLEDDYGRIYAKVAAGIAVKAAAAVAAGYAAKKLAEESKKMGGYAGLIGAVVGTGVGAGLLSQIKPDLRCWHTLPENFQLSRIFLPPGNYTVTLKYVDHSGNIVSTQNETIEIKPGKKTFLNKRIFSQGSSRFGFISESNQGKGYLGAKIKAIPPQKAQELGLSGSQGAYVNDVMPDSPAAKSGILPDDVIIACDGTSIQTPQDLIQVVRNSQAGQQMQLTIIRKKSQITIPVILGNAPEKIYNTTYPLDTNNITNNPGSSE
ncbi:MAG: PDZ domain-containing protein [Spirochaetes bacterium]|nr:PDZ domain-containing protein [Spirochaetota bacterium]